MDKSPNDNYIETINGIPFNMIFVEGGDVFMGENKEHKVTVPDFYIAETPCTQELWRAVMDDDRMIIRFNGKNNNPVEYVSWDDILLGARETNDKAFLKELNKIAKEKDYQLPSEAMWQFAAEGGNLTNSYEYAGSNNLKEVGWFDKNSHGEIKQVKLKLPNELGLFDMSGNIWEWCSDIWNQDVKKLPVNGFPNREGKEGLRVFRGGSWENINDFCRVASRNGFNQSYQADFIGFRLSRY